MSRPFAVLFALLVAACGGGVATPSALPVSTTISGTATPFDGTRVALPEDWGAGAGASEGELTVALLTATAKATAYRVELPTFGFIGGSDVAGVYAATAFDGSAFLSIEAYPTASSSIADLAIDESLIGRIAGGPVDELVIGEGEIDARSATIARFGAYENAWAVALVGGEAQTYLLVASTLGRDAAAEALLTALFAGVDFAD